MDVRIARVIARMETTLERQLSLRDFAADVQLSVSWLAHLFKRETGVSPALYRHRLQMARARLLLERTSMPVKDVVASVGLNDPSHFTRDFRRAYGVAPTELRAHTKALHWSRAGDCS